MLEQLFFLLFIVCCLLFWRFAWPRLSPRLGRFGSAPKLEVLFVVSMLVLGSLEVFRIEFFDWQTRDMFYEYGFYETVWGSEILVGNVLAALAYRVFSREGSGPAWRWTVGLGLLAYLGAMIGYVGGNLSLISPILPGAFLPVLLGIPVFRLQGSGPSGHGAGADSAGLDPALHARRCSSCETVNLPTGRYCRICGEQLGGEG